MKTTDNTTASKAKSSMTDDGLPAVTPDAQHDLASRPTKATPAARDGHLPEVRLRPESLAVLGGMLNVFDRMRADGWPLQRSPGPAKPADDLHPTLRIQRTALSETLASPSSRHLAFTAWGGRITPARTNEISTQSTKPFPLGVVRRERGNSETEQTYEENKPKVTKCSRPSRQA